MDSYYISIDSIQILLANKGDSYLMAWSNQDRTVITKEELANLLAREFHLTQTEANNYVADLK